MRKTVLTLSFLLTGAVVATSTSSCGGGSSFNGSEGGFSTCAPGETQECSGPDNCVGGQVCTSSTAWSACECQNDAGQIEIDGSLISIDGGTMGSGGSSGSG